MEYVQCQTNVVMVHNTPSNAYSPIYQISLTYLKRQRGYGLDNIHQLFYLYLTLASKANVKWMSWWYTAHRLMVMHPHTKYHRHILKDKKIMTHTIYTNYLTLGSKVKWISWWYMTHRQHIVLWPYTHIPNIIDLSLKTKRLWSRQALLKSGRSGRRNRSRSGRKNHTKTVCLP